MTLSPDRQARINQQLTELARRAEGALDFWTVVCLSTPTPAARSFVAQNGERVRSLEAAIQAQFTEAGEKSHDALLQRLRDGGDEWESVFRVLADFHDRSPDEIVAAVQTLDRLYHQRRDAIIALGRAIGYPVASVEDETQERREYFRRILDTLAGLFLQAREPSPA